MATAFELITTKVAEGHDDARLGDIAHRLEEVGAHHCVVLDKVDRRFIGLVRLAEIATRAPASTRILADLVSPVPPLVIDANEPAEHVARLFEKHQLGEAVVVDEHGGYLGLVTALSVLVWSENERRRTDRALEEAWQKLKEASRAREKLIEGLSHELRTPLTPVLLMASQAALNASLPEDLRKDLTAITELVTYEARLIDQLLDQKDLERGSLGLTETLVEVDHVLRDAIAAAQQEISGKAIQLIYLPAAKSATTRGDRSRLQQAFANLLDNAIKFTPVGGTLRLSVCLPEDSPVVTITLSDTGVGLSPNAISGIFDAFGHDDGANLRRARAFPGLGLGLSIARGIVELHGGSIHAASGGENQGATFTVILPLASDNEFNSTRIRNVDGR